jgi:hypothetical protein
VITWGARLFRLLLKGARARLHPIYASISAHRNLATPRVVVHIDVRFLVLICVLQFGIVAFSMGVGVKKKTTPTGRLARKTDDLRLSRRMIVNLTRDEYERLRRAAANESLASFVRGVLRKNVHEQT